MNLPTTAADLRIPTRERRVDPDSRLMQVLKEDYGIADAKLLFVYAPAADGGKGAELNVLYASEKDLTTADLQGPVVLANTRVQASAGDVIKAVYVTGQTQYCITINGVPYWF